MRLSDGTNSIFRLSATLVGAVVGAGFASGREIVEYFGIHGTLGNLGVLVAGGMFFIASSTIMEICRRMQFANYRELIGFLCPRHIVGFFDAFMSIALLVGSSVVIAGLIALLQQQLNVSPIAAVVLTMILMGGVAVFGAQGVFVVNQALIPVLVVAVLVTSVNAIAKFGESKFPDVPQAWLSSAVEYVGYNSLFLVGVLGSIGRESKSWFESVVAAAICSAILTGLAIAIFLSVGSLMPGSVVAKIPMAFVAGSLGGWWSGIYAIGLGSAMVTTAVCGIQTLGRRFGRGEKGALLWSLMSLLLALLIAQVGFVPLVAHGYRIVGYIGILFWTVTASNVSLRWLSQLMFKRGRRQ